MYSEFLPYLFKLRSYIERGFEEKMSIETKKNIRDEFALYTMPLAQRIGIYFNESYLTDILELVNLYKKIDDETIWFTKEEMQKYVELRFNRVYFIKEKVIKEEDRMPYYNDSEHIDQRLRRFATTRQPDKK